MIFTWKWLFSLKIDQKRTQKGPKKRPKNFLQRPKTRSYIFSSCSGIWNSCLCEVCSHLLNCSRNYIFSSLLKYSTFKIFLILTSLEQTLKNTMLNKSGYFRTLPSIKKPTHLDLWRKSQKLEVESYIIDHDFRKIQVKNTASYWILPYIYQILPISDLYLTYISSIHYQN